MKFDTTESENSESSGSTTAVDVQSETASKSKPSADKKTKANAEKKAKQPAAKKPEDTLPTGIHATECVINSECTLTAGCRGRLKTTNPIGGKVQVYCPKCTKFAEGTRPTNGMVAASGIRTFDRTAGKLTEE